MTDDRYRMLYTNEEAQAIFGVSRQTLNAWCQKGVLTKIKKPGIQRFYITGESVKRFIKEGEAHGAKV